jgi:hypothetical protein
MQVAGDIFEAGDNEPLSPSSRHTKELIERSHHMISGIMDDLIKEIDRDVGVAEYNNQGTYTAREITKILAKGKAKKLLKSLNDIVTCYTEEAAEKAGHEDPDEVICTSVTYCKKCHKYRNEAVDTDGITDQFAKRAKLGT